MIAFIENLAEAWKAFTCANPENDRLTLSFFSNRSTWSYIYETPSYLTDGCENVSQTWFCPLFVLPKLTKPGRYYMGVRKNGRHLVLLPISYFTPLRNHLFILSYLVLCSLM